MTKEKVKEIIEDIFEGEWKENILISTNFKIDVDSMSTLQLLIELNYIKQEFSDNLDPIITLN